MLSGLSKKAQNWIVFSGIGLGLVLFLFLGIILGRLFSHPKLTIDPQINIVELTGVILSLISIIVTILLGIYISDIIDKKKQNERFEKDHIIKKIDELDTIINRFATFLEDSQTTGQRTSQILYSDIVGHFKTTQVKIVFIETVFNIYFPTITTISNRIAAIKSQVNALQNQLTNIPSQQPGSPQSMFILNNNLHIDSRSSRLLIADVTKIQQDLFNMQIEINRMN